MLLWFERAASFSRSRQRPIGPSEQVVRYDKPNCVGAAFLVAAQTRPQICREAIPPRIGHCRALGLAGSQPKGGKFSIVQSVH